MYTVCAAVLADRVSAILYILCRMQHRVKTDYAAAIFKANLLRIRSCHGEARCRCNGLGSRPVFVILTIHRFPSQSLQFRTHPSPSTDSNMCNFQQRLACALNQQMAPADIGSTGLSSQSAVTVLNTGFGCDSVTNVTT
jgi:hypothetical protein